MSGDLEWDLDGGKGYGRVLLNSFLEDAGQIGSCDECQARMRCTLSELILQAQHKVGCTSPSNRLLHCYLEDGLQASNDGKPLLFQSSLVV